MTEEQIKQKAEAEVDKVIIGSGMDRASVIHLKHLLVTMYMQGATEATKELEAEVKEWKDKADLWCKTANLKDHNIMINKELEKENAELQHTIATLRQEKDNISMHAKAMEVVAKTKSDQLTKAKELLERLLITSCNSDVLNLLPNCSEVLRVRVEAEQFLKGE